MDTFFYYAIGILSWLCLALFFSSLIMLGVNYLRKKDLRIPGLCFIASLLIMIIVLIASPETKESAIPDSETVTDKSKTEETTTQTETITEPETEEETTVAETESEDEFKSTCQEIGYKKLLRTPDDYAGQRIVITAEVQQVIDGGLFDDSKYYRVQTDNNDSGYYFDDEYFMYDNRVNDDMKILDGDVLKIYGEFTGLETMKRVITGSKDEVPAIKAYYVELISE